MPPSAPANAPRPPCPAPGSRYEKLQRWDDALRAYRLKLEAAPPGSVAHVDALLGQCRCLAALAEWDKLFAVCRSEWSRVEPHVRREMAPIAAHAAWQLGDWGAMRQYVDVVAHGQAAGGAEGAFLSAVIAVKNQDYAAAAGEQGAGRWLAFQERELEGAALARDVKSSLHSCALSTLMLVDPGKS